MAHYAKLDSNNVVIQVESVHNNVENNIPGLDAEPLGVAFLQSIYPGTTWKKISYNNNFRGVYAGIGFTYDPVKDVFVNPNPIVATS